MILIALVKVASKFVDNFAPSTLRMPRTVVIVTRHTLITKKDFVHSTAIVDNSQVTSPLAVKTLEVVRLSKERDYIQVTISKQTIFYSSNKLIVLKLIGL